MLFLGDKGHYYGRFPWITTCLVVVNIFVFTAQVAIGDKLTCGFSLVPLEITTFQDLQGTVHRKVWVESRGDGSSPPQFVSRDISIKHYPGPVPIWLTLFTSMFMHGSVLHLVMNMWFLLVFGRNVECAMGHWLFLAVYIMCGVLAGLAHVASDMQSILPCLGASGAIAGVMGAYVSIYPSNNIKVWLGLWWVVDAPALFVIGLWALLQYLSAVMSDGNKMGGVAYWAHLGGFFGGIIIVRAIVIYLRNKTEAGAAAEEKALAPAGAVECGESGGIERRQSGAPDPFEGFITMQTIRRMQEKKKQ